MVFSSSLFLLYFLPLFLVGYSLLNKKFKNYWILLSSIIFYAWGAPKFVFVILCSTILDFYLVRTLHREDRAQRRKLYLFLSIFLNLGLLLFFKYSNFFVENVNNVLSFLGEENLKWTAIALPIGISFYTFQTLTYSIDIYKRREKPLERLSDYLVYIMSFPQMIAGPIVRFSTIAKQLVEREDKVNDKLIGFYRFTIGLAKKVLIANAMGEQADIFFSINPIAITTADAWVGLIAYTFQIYFDFSGYSDMAIGLGRMMGFTFPENFNFPYTSRSITEFWKRWHITLGTFMRDYLYIPLGGNRVSSNARLYFNLGIVFLLSGLWHGAAWNFVFWGAFHGAFLILDRVFLKNLLHKVGLLPSIVFTFFVTMIGWLLFRVESMYQFREYLKKLFSMDFGDYYNFKPFFFEILIVAVFFSFMGCNKYGRRFSDYFYNKTTYSFKEHVSLSLMSIIFLIICVGAISSSSFNPFIYFRF